MDSSTATLASVLASDVTKATALFNEALTYLRLASDHAKFIRNYFDPTEEQGFRLADRLAVSLDLLRAELCSLQEPVAPATVNAFINRAVPVIDELIRFKNAVADAVDRCTTQQLLPAHFIRHLRREASFFLGIIAHVLGRPTPDRETLDLPGPPTERVATIARTLIDVVPLADTFAADLAYTEFWGKHHMEHAETLGLLLRPQQEQLIAGARRFEERFRELVREAACVEGDPSVPRFEELDRSTIGLSRDWRNFLVNAQQAQRNCSLQTNFPQRLTEHLRIETDILEEAVERVQQRRRHPAGVPPAAATGATFQSLTPKAILCS